MWCLSQYAAVRLSYALSGPVWLAFVVDLYQIVPTGG